MGVIEDYVVIPALPPSASERLEADWRGTHVPEEEPEMPSSASDDEFFSDEAEQSSVDGESESSEEEYQMADFLTPAHSDAVDTGPTDIVAVTPDQVQDFARKLIFHGDEQPRQIISNVEQNRDEDITARGIATVPETASQPAST
eukprot:GHVR01052139.1.p2 GENE.GHVR01052139.1~~GHVR01052139.1.p2  ORF type:complete len:145 (+),score=30.25 GHVR01052139.1:172-606(+)